jgi:hypothetical protein
MKRALSVLFVLCALGLSVTGCTSSAVANRTIAIDCSGGKDVYLPKGQKLVSTRQTSLMSREVICTTRPMGIFESPQQQERSLFVDTGEGIELRQQCTIHETK